MKDLLREIEPIIVKIWDMSQAAVRPDAEPDTAGVVRTATLKWAREELLNLLKHRSRPELKEKIISLAQGFLPKFNIDNRAPEMADQLLVLCPTEEEIKRQVTEEWRQKCEDMVAARHNTDFSHRRSDSYVEDKNRGCNAADAVQLSPFTTIDPPFVVVVEPPL